MVGNASTTVLNDSLNHLPEARPSTALPVFSWRRKALVVMCLILLMGTIGSAFWYQDLRYSLPTPKPPQLVQPDEGKTIQFPENLAAVLAGNSSQPIFLHFFNASCPCSRFNVDHIAELYRDHGKAARFVAVVQAEGDAETLEKLRQKATDALSGMTAVVDTEGHAAQACGVYSTPQAVLLTADRHLVYRGNYNISRYCGDRITQFARLALEATLAGQPVPAMSPVATTAYGCELPANSGTQATLFR